MISDFKFLLNQKSGKGKPNDNKQKYININNEEETIIRNGR
jgi:hypothetical protein